MGKIRLLLLVLSLTLVSFSKSLAEPVIYNSENTQLLFGHISGDVIEPGTNITLTLSVRNKKEVPVTYLSYLEIPPEWRSVFFQKTLTLEGQSEDLLIMNLYIPESAPAGEQIIKFSMEEEEDPGNYAGMAIAVEVAPKIKLEVELFDMPERILAGTPYSVSASVRNLGNAVTDISILLKSSDNISISTKPEVSSDEKYTLKSGEELAFQIEATPPEDLSKIIHHSIQFAARRTVDNSDEQENAENAAWVSQTSRVEVVPTAGGEPIFQTIPAYAKTMNSFDSDNDFMPLSTLEFSAFGPLDDSQQSTLSVKVKKHFDPLQDYSMLHPNDIYRAEYKSEQLDISAGDFGHPLSPLLSSYLYGRGGYASISFPSIGGGGLYSYRNNLKEGNHNIFGYVEYKVPDDSVSNGSIYRAVLNDYYRNETGNIISLYQHYYPHPELFLQAEIAADPQETGTETAYYLHGTGIHDWIQYQLRGAYGTTNYTGSFADTFLVNGQLKMIFFEKRLESVNGFEEYFDSPNFEGGFAPDRERKIFQTSAGYTFDDILTKITGGYKFTSDESFDGSSKDLNNTLTLSAEQPFDWLDSTIRVNGSWGFLRNEVAATDSLQQQYGLKYHLKPLPELTSETDLSYSNKLTGTLFDENFFSFKTGASWSPNDQKLGASIGGNFGLMEDDSTTFFYSIDYTISPWEHHRFFAGLKHDIVDGDFSKNFLFYLGYQTDFDVPVGKKASIGNLYGRITRSDNSPAPGIILKLGKYSAVTNEDGLYTFGGVPVGKYYLQIDRANLKAEEMADIAAPVEVEIIQGEDSELNIIFYKKAVVTGTVNLYDFETEASITTENQSRSVVLTGGIPYAVIEMTSEKQSLRITTNRKGFFRAPDLLPGKWTLRLIKVNLPEFHVMEPDEFTLEIEENSRTEVEFKALPQIREIQIISNDETLMLE